MEAMENIYLSLLAATPRIRTAATATVHDRAKTKDGTDHNPPTKPTPLPNSTDPILRYQPHQQPHNFKPY